MRIFSWPGMMKREGVGEEQGRMKERRIKGLLFNEFIGSWCGKGGERGGKNERRKSRRLTLYQIHYCFLVMLIK